MDEQQLAELELLIAADVNPAVAIAAVQQPQTSEAPQKSEAQLGETAGRNLWLIVGLIAGLVVSLLIGF